MASEYKAKLNNLRMAPRKVSLVADLVRGKDLKDALLQLQFLNKAAAEPVKKVLESAAANAKDLDQVKKQELKVAEIFVTEAAKYKRARPVSRGRSHMIIKRGSNILVKLTPKTTK
jgi:large subunit ribosomal protein L22